MITDHMHLVTRADARQWASDMGIDARDDDPAGDTDTQIARLADWIWAAKSAPNCTYAAHPIRRLTPEQFWAICEGRRVA